MKRIVLAGLMIGLFVAAGCRGAKSEKEYDLSRDKLTVADLPEAKSLTVTFESKDGVTVTAVLVKKEDADAALKAVEDGKTPKQAITAAKTIARQEAPKGNLTSPNADAKTNWSVLLHSEKPTKVTVRTRGK